MARNKSPDLVTCGENRFKYGKKTYKRFHFEARLRLELSITYETLLCYSVKQKVIICCRPSTYIQILKILD